MKDVGLSGADKGEKVLECINGGTYWNIPGIKHRLVTGAKSMEKVNKSLHEKPALFQGRQRDLNLIDRASLRNRGNGQQQEHRGILLLFCQ